MAGSIKKNERRVPKRGKGKKQARRASSPRKLPKRELKTRQPFTEWFIEVAYVVTGLVAVFLLASLLSFNFSGGGLVNSSTEVYHNIMGKFGHWTATLLVGLFGYAAYGFFALVLAAAVGLWLKSEEKLEFVFPGVFASLFGLFCLMFGFSIFSVLIVNAEGGGIMGVKIVAPMVAAVGTLGSSLLCVSLILTSVGLISQTSPGTLCIKSSKFLGVGGAFLFRSFYNCITELFGLGASATSSLFSSFFDLFGERSERRSADEEYKLPDREKRKSKKTNLKSSTKSISEKIKAEAVKSDVDDEDAEAEEEREILVTRRKRNELKKKQKAGKSLRKKLRKAKKEGPVAEPPVAYVFPETSLLTKGEEIEHSEEDELLRKKSRIIESKLKDFSIAGRVTEVHPGPVITLFEFEPAPGVKVGKIASLQDDLAMSLRASAIRIIAPIPKKGTVGIEVPNKAREIVRLRDVLESEEFTGASSSLTMAIGKDTYGDPVVADIAKMPHLLIAGATGTGKSVCINALLLSLLYRADPSDLGLILIDPKILELSIYEGVPHLRVPVVTRPKQARAVLDWAVQEMDRRYRMMHEYGVRSIDGYNALVLGEDHQSEGIKEESSVIVDLKEDDVLEEGLESSIEPEGAERPIQRQLFGRYMEKLPKIVIVIDELADLMLSVGKEIEDLIARLAQKARAAGIHLIVATQRPSVDVITGLIKANFPARLSFRVSSRIDSRTILDSMGAEKLLGMGDMLFMSPGAVHIQRFHGAFVSDAEVKRVIDSIKDHGKPRYDQKIIDVCEKALIEDSNQADGSNGDNDADFDPLYDEAVNFVLTKGKASTSLLQRAFRIGYNRAARIIDIMEREGVIGPVNGAKPREVLINTLEEE